MLLIVATLLATTSCSFFCPKSFEGQVTGVATNVVQYSCGRINVTVIYDGNTYNQFFDDGQTNLTQELFGSGTYYDKGEPVTVFMEHQECNLVKIEAYRIPQFGENGLLLGYVAQTVELL